MWNSLQFGDKEVRKAEQESVRVVETCNHQGMYYLHHSFLRQTRPNGSNVTVADLDNCDVVFLLVVA